jgi:hypothetical protein
MARLTMTCAAVLLTSCAGGPSTVSVLGSSPVASGNDGSGRVVSDPPGIDCTITPGNMTGDCSTSFAKNTVVTLTATPTSTSLFISWVNLASGADFDYEETLGFQAQPILMTNPFPFNVDQDRDLVLLASFVAKP